MNIHNLLTPSIYTPIYNPFLIPATPTTALRRNTNEIGIQSSPPSPDISHSSSKKQSEKWDYSVRDIEKWWNYRKAIYWVLESSRNKTKAQVNSLLLRQADVNDDVKTIILNISERQYLKWKQGFEIAGDKLHKKFQKKGELPVYLEFLSKDQLQACIKRFHYNLHMKDADSCYASLRKKYWPISRRFVREYMKVVVKECEQCNRTDTLPEEPKRSGSVVKQIKRPNERWIMGKYFT